jgi:hypothetical protein
VEVTLSQATLGGDDPAPHRCRRQVLARDQGEQAHRARDGPLAAWRVRPGRPPHRQRVVDQAWRQRLLGGRVAHRNDLGLGGREAR